MMVCGVTVLISVLDETGGLALFIIVSCTIRLHVGFLAIALAWIVGVYIDDMSARKRPGHFQQPPVSCPVKRRRSLDAGRADN